MSNCKKYEGLIKKISKFLWTIKELHILDGKLMVFQKKRLKRLDSSIEKYPIESIDKDNNDFPIKENSEINKNEIDENAFPLDEDQKIGENINDSVQINNQDNNKNHYYNNYQNINTPGNIYNINPIPYN